MTRGPSRRRAGRTARPALALLGLLVTLFVVVPAGPASAHAHLDHSTPADGASADTAPPDLQLQFSESVVVDATRIEITDTDGRRFPTGPVHVLAAGAGRSGPITLAAALPWLPRNAYRVSWETLSSDDLHRTSGVLVFGVGQHVAAGGLHESLPRPDEASLRWLVFLALALSLGGAACERLFRRHLRATALDAAARCRRLSRVGAASGAGLAGVLLLDQLASGHWAGRRLLVGAYGQHWLLREAGLALLVLSAGNRLAPRLRTTLLLLGVAAACTGSALLGHAATGTGLVALHVLADAAHLGAAATWAGGVLVLGLVAVPMLRRGFASAETARAALHSFAVPAAACLSVMVVTGVYLASGVVGSVDALLLTFYGRTLLLKLLVAALAGGLGLLTATRLRRGLDRPAPRRTVLVEGIAVAGVLLLAAVLTSAQPATEPQLTRTSGPATVRVVDGQAADLQETLAIRPNRPGRNVVLLGVFDTRRPAPAPIAAVTITVQATGGVQQSSLTAEQLADHQWSVPVALTAAGTTTVHLSVRRAGLPDAGSTFHWTVGAAPTHLRARVLSQAPLRRILTIGAGGLAVLVLYGWLLARYWRRLRTTRRHPIEEQHVEVPEYADAMAP